MKRHINISILAALMIAVSLSFVGCTGVQKQEDSTVSGETGTKEGEGHVEKKYRSLKSKWNQWK